jgi:hypothetical protein
MRRAMRWLDAAGAWGLVLFGCLHNFFGAPRLFHNISDSLFWFVSAGLALWYSGAVNLVRQSERSRFAVWTAVPVNLTLLAFVTAFGLHSGAIARPDGMLLVAIAAIETIFSLVQAFSTDSPLTQSE